MIQTLVGLYLVFFEARRPDDPRDLYGTCVGTAVPLVRQVPRRMPRKLRARLSQAN
ncbi:MAG: hypothetical protein HYX52_02715 [Chloroflexi bacterium]|nr:hypothetical protein [Chloroflexota bacterium]